MTEPRDKAKRWGMVIDLNRCIGCQTCAVGCKIKNNLADGVWWNRVVTVGGSWMDTAGGDPEHAHMFYIPLSCMHCQDAPCVKACPTGATYQRDDGIVLVDYDLCIGCRACVEACPYDARTFERDPQHTYTDFPLGGSDIPVIQPGVAEKCTFCSERIDAGLQPFCVEVCPARARYFGDLNDPESTVSRIIREGQAETLLPELGTEPAVYYVLPQHSVSAPTGPDLVRTGKVGAAIEELHP